MLQYLDEYPYSSGELAEDIVYRFSGRSFDDIAPWKNIRDVTIAGEEMVFFPKFYVKNTTVNNQPAWFISDTPRDGYHLHPAFFNNGREVDNGVAISKYCIKSEYDDNDTVIDIHSYSTDLAETSPYPDQTFVKWINDFRNTDPSDPDKSGWHLWNIYEYAMLQRLALIEARSPELYAIADPYGLCEMTGEVTYDCGFPQLWVYGAGLHCINNKCYWRILNNRQTDFVTIDAQFTGTTTGDIKKMSFAVGDGYDMGDVFLPESLTETFAYDNYEATGWVPRATMYARPWSEHYSIPSSTTIEDVPENNNGEIIYPSYFIANGFSFSYQFQRTFRRWWVAARFAKWC